MTTQPDAQPALETHILEMAVAIEAQRRARDYSHPVEQAMLQAREAAKEWEEADADMRQQLAMNLAVRQAHAVWNGLVKSNRLVARLKERDAITYVIKLNPGCAISARSLGKQLCALSMLLAGEAKAVGQAKLQSTVSDLRYDKQANEISVQLALMHTMPGVVKEDADAP